MKRRPFHCDEMRFVLVARTCDQDLMNRVIDLPPAVRDVVGTHDFIVFDGECVLCSNFMQFMYRHDRARRFRFIIAQEPLGLAIYEALGLPTDRFETNIIAVDGRIYTKLESFGKAMSTLGFPWRAAALTRYVPRMIGAPIYDAIATNRYRLFGRTEQCMIPTPDLRERFLSLPADNAA